MKYKFVKNHSHIFPIEKICKVLKINASGYYKWKKRVLSNRMLRKNNLKKQITQLYFRFKQRYGAPRITAELNALGYKISLVTVAI